MAFPPNRAIMVRGEGEKASVVAATYLVDEILQILDSLDGNTMHSNLMMLVLLSELAW